MARRTHTDAVRRPMRVNYRFKNEWAQRYDPSKFRVNVVSGKIPTFIYYDAAGTELERVALDDKTAEQLSEVRCSTFFLPTVSTSLSS